MKSRKCPAAALVGLLLGAVLLGAGGAACGDAPREPTAAASSSTASATASPTPAPTPTALSTPEQTATPTPTPAPTWTPTASPEPCPTAAEAAYLRGLGDAVWGIDEATFNLERLFIRLENDPQIVFTDRFVRDFAAVAAVAEYEAQKILDLTPPKSIPTSSGVHHTATSLARATIYSMKHFADGFDRLDIAAFEQGVYMLESLEIDLPLVRDEIDGFCE